MSGNPRGHVCFQCTNGRDRHMKKSAREAVCKAESVIWVTTNFLHFHQRWCNPDEATKVV